MRQVTINWRFCFALDDECAEPMAFPPADRRRNMQSMLRNLKRRRQKEATSQTQGFSLAPFLWEFAPCFTTYLKGGVGGMGLGLGKDNKLKWTSKFTICIKRVKMGIEIYKRNLGKWTVTYHQNPDKRTIRQWKCIEEMAAKPFLCATIERAFLGACKSIDSCDRDIWSKTNGFFCFGPNIR